MGLYVRPNSKHRFSVWEEKTVPTRSRKPVPRESYGALGFNYDWSFEEARAWAKLANKKNARERKAIVAAARRIEEASLVDSIYLPEVFLKEFDNHLEEVALGADDWLAKLKIHWKTAREIILELEITPDKFFDSRFKILREMTSDDRKYSVGYIKRLRYIMNEWGKFYARKTKTYFEPIPALTGTQREKVIESHEEKSNVRKVSKPLLWKDLQAKETPFKTEDLEEQWNWLVIASWFGLRPKETDNLKTPEGKFWKLKQTTSRVELWVYQTKLKGIPKDERWKPIPIVFPEQKLALKLFQSGKFRRPLTKTIQRLLGDGFDTYSPRKAFTDLMLLKGFSLEDVAIFMGHRDISQTWDAYKDKKTYKIPEQNKGTGS